MTVSKLINDFLKKSNIMARESYCSNSRIYGFTFIEILVVLLIFSLMISLASPILRVRRANSAASTYAKSIKSRIEAAYAYCLPHLYKECMLAFSPELINRSGLIAADTAANRTALQSNYGDINYVEIFLGHPYAKDAKKSDNLAYHSADDISRYGSDFYSIRAIGKQDDKYYTKFFVSIIDGSFGDYRGKINSIYVYPVMSSSDSEFSYGKIYKIKILSNIADMCEISFSSCPGVETDDVGTCYCR